MITLDFNDKKINTDKILQIKKSEKNKKEQKLKNDPFFYSVKNKKNITKYIAAKLNKTTLPIEFISKCVGLEYNDIIDLKNGLVFPTKEQIQRLNKIINLSKIKFIKNAII